MSTDTGTSSQPASSESSGKKYPIHLHRNGHVGDRSHVVLEFFEDDDVSVHMGTSTRRAGRKQLAQHLRLEGVWTTIEVDSHQDEVHATLDVSKLTDGNAVVLENKKIDVVKGQRKEDAVLSVGGKPVSAKLRKDLESLFSFRIDSASSNEAIFGAREPQAVGARWPIDGDRARQDMTANVDATATAISGEATLVGVEHVGDTDVLRLKVDMQIDGLVVPVQQRGATCEPSQGRTTATILYPLDAERGPLEEHTTANSTIRIRVAGPRGVATGDVDAVSRHDAYVTPM